MEVIIERSDRILLAILYGLLAGTAVALLGFVSYTLFVAWTVKPVSPATVIVAVALAVIMLASIVAYIVIGRHYE